MKRTPVLALLLVAVFSARAFAQTGQGLSGTFSFGPERPRAREIGLVVGVFRTGQHNAITDVAGVRVGQATIIEGGDIRTGVTAIVPHPGDVYAEPVPAWIHSGNGYGKLIGETQVREFGEIESPILLVCTLCVWSAAQALTDILTNRAGEAQHTLNPIVGETNDSRVNDMWRFPVRREHVKEALDNAKPGPVAEGSVGAGTGTSAFGWKGGIGTSSRVIPGSLGGYTVGVLVQSNFGGILTMNGAPVGRELGGYSFQAELGALADSARVQRDDGSIMMVVATDAPLDATNLRRLAERAIMGLARTGSFANNSSGDYVIAFSTAQSVRRKRTSPGPYPTSSLLNASMGPLFNATVEATEEAIYNSLLRATTITGRGRTIEAIPIDRLLPILRKHNALEWDRNVPPGRRP